jgi:hypothetical protein
MSGFLMEITKRSPMERRRIGIPEETISGVLMKIAKEGATMEIITTGISGEIAEIGFLMIGIGLIMATMRISHGDTDQGITEAEDSG